MTTYSLDDIGLIPSTISNIEHRSECNPYNTDDMLPIFTAPMNAVINETNYQEFLNYKINTVIPRGVDFKIRCNLATKTFVAFSLQECASFASLMQYEETDDVYYVCIDVAQGAMSRLLSLIQKLKEIFGYRIVIMTGNIANPETYFEYAKVGVDFIRCSVGSGSCCVTKDTIITMGNYSKKPISDISVGEYVQTLSGPKKVINTFSKKSKTVVINNNIECTPDHKFLVINKKDQHNVNETNISEYAFYIEAQHLTSEYLLIQDKNV